MEDILKDISNAISKKIEGIPDGRFKTEIEFGSFTIQADGEVYRTYQVTPGTADRLNPTWIDQKDIVVFLLDVEIFKEESKFSLTSKELKEIGLQLSK